MYGSKCIGKNRETLSGVLCVRQTLICIKVKVLQENQTSTDTFIWFSGVYCEHEKLLNQLKGGVT
jgi:hypothetical protein